MKLAFWWLRDLQKRAYDKIDAFFKLPVSEKEKFEVPGIGGARGYTVFGKEHAKHTRVGDLKEFFHVGVDLPEGHALAGTKDYPPQRQRARNSWLR